MTMSFPHLLPTKRLNFRLPTKPAIARITYLSVHLTLLLLICGCEMVNRQNEIPKVAESITPQTCAGIVYNETASLRPTSLPDARNFIASVAYKRKGQGMAPAKIPSDSELANATVKAIWEDCLNAADNAKNADPGNCINFVIWPSGDNGKTPDKDPKLGAAWPYNYKSDHSFGPFQNPTKVGDVPASTNVYVFVYCGVPQDQAESRVGRLLTLP